MPSETAPSETVPSGTVPAPALAPGEAAARPRDELDEDVGSLQHRLATVRLLIIFVLVIPAVAVVLQQGLTGRALFLVPGTAVLVVLVERVAWGARPSAGRAQRWHPALVALVVLLGAALYGVGQMAWLTALAVSAATLGRFAPTRRVTVVGVAACAAYGLGISAALDPGYGNLFSAALVPALAGFLASSAERRNYLIHRLRETRAELARMAVAEERLRIARDLHDLLGHSLSLIALKAELAGRLLDADPARAAGEISDLETVARRSLTEVRQAVTSYRQPSLAAELAAARRMLASAGVDCQLDAPAAYSLPPAVDALLAWTVREGATNILRHSGARRAGIRIELGRSQVCAELTDDGTGGTGKPGGGDRAGRDRAGGGTGGPGVVVPAGGSGAASGSGLAGLAERAARLGGSLHAAAGERGGFRLQVRVPLTGPAGGGQAGAGNAAAAG